MKNRTYRWFSAVFSALFVLAFSIPARPQEESKAASAVQEKDASKPAQTPSSSGALKFTPGSNAKVEGIIVKHNADSLTIHDYHGSTIEVSLAQNTEVKEKKTNPFRGAHNYTVAQLLRGLEVEVDGHGGVSGTLIADKIRFTQDDLHMASALDARVVPVETRLGETETRLTQSEENALRLSGQVSELSAVSNAARGGAKAAQETADSAAESAKTANREAQAAKDGVRTANQRISSLDDFEIRSTVTVNFKVGSSLLSPEAQRSLDELAESSKSERGFVIEVAGFASAEGGDELNRALSQRRAEAVIHYLAENHDIPLRRFVAPLGYGTKQPVADNKTHTGRVQNRRVEVRILESKGQAQAGTITAGMR
jgi:outer membrane protein OmpA-like peptidoglycan-associated protein